LLPQLANHVVPLFVECSAEFTEKKLVQLLRKACPDLRPELGLSDMIAAIRCGAGTPSGKKVLIIFDQFEQWLHARGDTVTDELFKALRQCDGERVQAILLVRADFWMAVTWLLEDLEIDLVQGRNFAAIDLFPQRHAQKVLVAFGRAYGAIPAQGALDADQQKFITDSIEGLAQDGKVMCVRLAVYAEMMKNRPWGAASLKKIGGTEGVGVSFLEESFGTQANPKMRVHQLGARSVLKSLLPDGGTLINVQLKSYGQLFQASGYSDRKHFDDLIRMLDGELRLISPTDPKGFTQELQNEIPESAATDPGQKYYRLSHDYLIPALRSWLNRKQRETWRGRAELLLAELAGFWKTKRTHRYLPSVIEHARIRLLTSQRKWDTVETEMMRAAARNHGFWLAVTLCAIALLGTGILGVRNAMVSENQRIAKEQLEERHVAEASRLVDSLLTAETQRVSEVVVELQNYRVWADSKLHKSFDDFGVGSVGKLHAAMALADVSQECRDYLVAQLPLVSAEQFLPVCNTLRSAVTKLPEIHSEMAIDAKRPLRERLQAACAVAQFQSSNVVWGDAEFCQFVADNLTRLYPSELAPLRQALRPVAPAIIPPLTEIFLDHNREQQQRLFATESLVEYQQDSPDKLFDLLLDCDERQYPLVLRALNGHEALLIELANNVMSKSIAIDSPEPEKDVMAVHQANAAVALYQLKQFGPVWSAMSDVENPRLRSFIIHWLVNRGSSPTPLVEELHKETDRTRLQAVMLALGEFPVADFAPATLEQVTRGLEKKLREASTSDLRASAIWSLRALGQHELVGRIVDEQKELQGRRRQIWQVKIASAKNDLVSLQATARDRQDKAMAEAIAQIRTAESDLGAAVSVSAKLSSLNEIAPTRSTPTNSIVVVEGLSGGALRFPGDSTAKLTSGQDADIVGPFSYGCWFETEDNSQYSSLFSRMDADKWRGFDLWIERGQLAAHVKNSYISPDHPDNHYIKVVAQNPVADGQWHHAMVCYDGSQDASGLTIHIDGQPCKMVVVSNTMNNELTVSAPLIIAGRPNGFEFFGSLSNVKIINKFLSPREVRALYYSDLRPVALMNRSDLNRSQAQALERACFSSDLQMLTCQEVWNQLERDQVSELKSAESDWWYTSQDQWMIRLNAGKFRMGTLPTEAYSPKDATQQTRIIDRTFALAAHEVTVRQWLDFQKSAQPNLTNSHRFRNSADWAPDSPMVNITWCEAVQYCNWLNEQEGIPQSQWCYVPDPVHGYAPGMQTKPEFWKLTGYRLPTGSEWEFACRGGSTAIRSYGTDDSLLGKYAWYQVNSNDQTAGVGLLKPNRYGFFDMNGNAAEWVFDVFNEYPYNAAESVDHPGRHPVLTTEHRTLRGGGYYDLPKYVTSTIRFSFDPTHSLAVTGLRIARTLSDSPKIVN
jgi:formylglycine-generating enzyme required for sulfatase activity